MVIFIIVTLLTLFVYLLRYLAKDLLVLVQHAVRWQPISFSARLPWSKTVCTTSLRLQQTLCDRNGWQ